MHRVIVFACELPHRLRFVPLIRYAWAKFKKELSWEVYVADNLRIMGAGHRYVKTDAKPDPKAPKEEATYPTWIEQEFPHMKPSVAGNSGMKTIDDIILAMQNAGHLQ